MIKQIDGQISFDFVEVSDTKEISMEDYMNKPEKEALKEKKIGKKKQTLKNSKLIEKNLPAKEIGNLKHNIMKERHPLPSQKETPNENSTEKKSKRKNSSAAKSISVYTEHYQHAADYVKEHHSVTIGTIMRLCQISANDASKIFQKLIENKVIHDSGKLYKEKKEL